MMMIMKIMMMMIFSTLIPFSAGFVVRDTEWPCGSLPIRLPGRTPSRRQVRLAFDMDCIDLNKFA